MVRSTDLSFMNIECTVSVDAKGDLSLTFMDENATFLFPTWSDTNQAVQS